MGMVALIKVGVPTNLDAAQAVKRPDCRRSRNDDAFGQFFQFFPATTSRQMQKPRTNGNARSTTNASAGSEQAGHPSSEPQANQHKERRPAQRQPTRPVRDRSQDEACDHCRQISEQHLVRVPLHRAEGPANVVATVVGSEPHGNRQSGVQRGQEEEWSEAIVQYRRHRSYSATSVTRQVSRLHGCPGRRSI